MVGGGTHSCLGCGQNSLANIGPRTGKWWGTTGLCKHLRPQRGKGYKGVGCLRYYRANGLYNTNKRTPLLALWFERLTHPPRQHVVFEWGVPQGARWGDVSHW